MLDHNKKGSVTFTDENVEFSAIQGLHHDSFIHFSLSEYVFVSTSVALIIAMHFPGVHKQIVSKATSRLEYRSLYWGTAVVSNIFTYGLVLVFGMSIMIYALGLEKLSVLIVLMVQEVIVHVILFVGTLFVIIRGSHSENIPIPKGVVSTLFYPSFCCFVCFASSALFSKKMIKFMVVFGFMTFIYHNVMDLISLAFIMLVDQFRAKAITITILYISLVVFLIFAISFVLFQLSHMLRRKKHIKLFTFFATIIIFCFAVIFLFAMFVTLLFATDYSGVNVVATVILPSIVLSAGSWYIKRRFQEELNISNEPHDNETGIQHTPNGGEMITSSVEQFKNTTV